MGIVPQDAIPAARMKVHERKQFYPQCSISTSVRKKDPECLVWRRLGRRWLNPSKFKGASQGANSSCLWEVSLLPPGRLSFVLETSGCWTREMVRPFPPLLFPFLLSAYQHLATAIPMLVQCVPLFLLGEIVHVAQYFFHACISDIHRCSSWCVSGQTEKKGASAKLRTWGLLTIGQG